MAAPVAAGNLALMYQAWYENFGTWPTFEEARNLLMNSATNTEHDIWSQGGGLVNADTGTDVAAGYEGLLVFPAEWAVGDYRGDEYGGFAHIINPGERDRQTFTVTNMGDSRLMVRVTSETHVQIGMDDLSFTSLDQSLDHGDFTTPDYAFRIDQLIPPQTDLLMVRLSKPYAQFDPNEDLFEPFNNWRVHIQNWTDLDHDGLLWDDANGNGKVDLGEVDSGEHIRFTYGYNTGPTQQARIANPLARMGDGIFVTLRHRDQVPEVPQTDLGLEVSYWQLKNWQWARPTRSAFSLAPGETRSFVVTLSVPPNTPYGMYQGSVTLHYGAEDVVVPVTVAVAASGTTFDFGQANAPNGRSAAILDVPMLYDNDTLFGYTDYSWRNESGDWRFFWTDVDGGDLPANGTSYLVVDNSWAGAGSDIDTLIMGPTNDCLSNGVDCEGLLAGYAGSAFYGPYTLLQVGGSANNYVGSGRWLFDTTTGGPREIVAAPVQDGLHGIFFHQVRVDGSSLNEPFGGSVGLVNLDPGAIVSSAAAGPGSASLTISSELEMGGFVAQGFGLGSPVTTTEDIFQDDPNDPSTASFVTTVEIRNGALLEVSTCCSVGSDIDLFVYGPSGALLGSSTTATDVENVTVIFPEDGTYTVAVHGWSVPSGADSFELTINAVQGADVSVSNLPASIPVGGSASIDVNWDTTGFAAGTYYGLILMGPAEAPGLLSVPVEITIP
jgi:hypothetical protein